MQHFEESEETFRLLADASLALMWVADPKGACLFVNEAWREYTGQSAEEAKQQGWWEKLHPEDAEKWQSMWQAFSKAEDVFEAEVRLLGKNGYYRWHLFRARSKRNAKGEIETWYGSGIDIQDKKQQEKGLLPEDNDTRAVVEKVEQEIIQSKELLQSVIDAPTLGLAVYKAVRNAEGDIVDFVHEFVNKTTCEWLGQDFTGKLLSDHGSDGTIQLPNFIAAIETGKPVTYIRYVEFNGSTHWIAFTNTPLSVDRLLHMWEDITDQKQADAELLRLKDVLAQNAEEKYRTLFNSIDEGFAVIDLILDQNGRPVDTFHIEVNPAYERHTGLSDIVGKRGLEVVPSIGEWLDFYGDIARTGEAIRLEYYVDPIDRWLSCYVSRVGGEDSLRLAVIFNDITERKRREAHQDLLVEIWDDLSRLVTPDEIMQAVGSRLGEYLHLGICVFVDVDEGQGEVTIHHGWNREGVTSLGQQTFRMRDYTTEEFQRASRAGEIFIIRDAATDERVDGEAYARLNVGAWLSVPFRQAGHWTAFLSVTDTAPRDWRSDEVELVRTIADRVFPRIERARAEEVLRVTEERMRALKEAYKSVVNGAKVDDSLRLLSDLVVKETFGEARTTFYVANEEGTFLHPIYGAGNMPDAYLDEINKFLIGNDSLACGLAIPTGQPVIASDVFQDLLWKPWTHVAEKYAYRACWSFPIKTRDNHAIGTFTMYFQKARRASPKDLAFADVITQAAAIIISSHIENQQRVRAEQALRESEERLQIAVNTAKTVLWEWNILQNKIETTPNFEDVYGLSSIDFAEQGYSLLHPNDREAHLQKVQKAVTEEGGYFSQFRIIRPDTSEIIWLEERANAVLDETGKIVKLIGASIDITELKKTEEARQQSEQQLRKRERELSRVQEVGLVAGIDISFTDTIELSHSWRSPEYQKLHGLLPGIEYETHDDWLRRIHPEDRDRANRVLKEALNSGSPFYQSEYRIIRPIDGQIRWIFARVDIECDADEKPIRLVGAHIDVTERKQVEQRLHEFTSHLEQEVAERTKDLRANAHFIEKLTVASPDNLFVMNIHTREVVYANRSPAEVLGYTKAQREQMGNQFLDIVHPEDVPYFVAQVQNMDTAKDGEVRVIEYHVIDAQRNVRWMQDRNAVFKRDAQGRVVEKIGVTHEVTEQKKDQEEVIRLRLLQQKEVVEAVLRSQEKERERIGEALHNGIGQLLYAAQIRCDLLEEMAGHNTKLIRELTEILSEAITETRNISFELVPTVLRDFGWEVAIKTLLERLSHPGLHLRFVSWGMDQRLSENLEISMYRIVQELLNNIVKHARATKAHVSIRKNVGQIVLKVKDNGVGFDPKKEGEKNKGIGLQSIQNRAKLLNAKLDIKSQLEKGTSVTMQIPFEEEMA